ncbi:hypothetical protein B0H14DRAFT_3485285 [Mycena olivaceomarginata]|nr:hypothetical protein B0H14DRAFT_3485285 [Mycena olivaceomarginata]
MPVVATLRAEDDQARSAKAEFRPTPAVPVHAMFEFELRVGHVHTALEDIRRLLLVCTGKYKYKDRFEHSTGPNTQAKTSINNVDERLQQAATDYQVARAALVNLGPVLQETEWKKQLRVLEQDDIRQRPQVDLVEEEMCRVSEFLQWKADQWGARIEERLSTGLDEVLEEGLIAYARQQAQTTLALRGRFQENWRSVLSYIALGRAGLGQVPQDQAGAAGNQGPEEEEEDDDEEDEAELIGEIARDARVAASFVEESLA